MSTARFNTNIRTRRAQIHAARCFPWCWYREQIFKKSLISIILQSRWELTISYSFCWIATTRFDTVKLFDDKSLLVSLLLLFIAWNWVTRNWIAIEYDECIPFALTHVIFQLTIFYLTTEVWNRIEFRSGLWRVTTKISFFYFHHIIQWPFTRNSFGCSRAALHLYYS